ncbi:MAG: exodeoxyribonuclease VII small subunit [Synechococcaceae bacterium WBB_3_034]|jgi:exodeoxyribonuclease VII small subunit|nr:exodeoxyribonuclease VII small subunit [Synechococcaceae bacterium WBB_3_034]NDG23837.1 exodeoxyribonuclease VII small subunit [Synechococcaceae bacterium WBB_10_009]
MADSKPKRKAKAAGGNASPEPQWLQEVELLSYRDAQTALELTLAHLQSSELEVEEMAGLYRRAEAYANRCERVLETVEQEVIEWSA